MGNNLKMNTTLVKWVDEKKKITGSREILIINFQLVPREIDIMINKPSYIHIYIIFYHCINNDFTKSSIIDKDLIFIKL